MRPEKLLLETADSGRDLNRVEGPVEAVTYLGDATIYDIVLAGTRLTVRQANRDGVPRHAVGDRVAIVWSPNDCAIVG